MNEHVYEDLHIKSRRAQAIDRIEAAVCVSEIAGSGHASGDIPCEWHTAKNEKVRRLISALEDLEPLPRVHVTPIDEDDQ